MCISFRSRSYNRVATGLILFPLSDLVVWDSHPLALGATPAQVYIDGIPQLDAPFVVPKPSAYQASPLTPNFDKEAADALKYEGLPPLLPTDAEADIVLFTNVSSVIAREGSELQEMFASKSAGETGVVLVKNGKMLCYGAHGSCVIADHHVGGPRPRTVDLRGGAISPGLISYGSPLGLQEIDQEPSTGDGYVYDPLTGTTPKLLDDAVVRAVDGLQFAGRSALCVTLSHISEIDRLTCATASRIAQASRGASPPRATGDSSAGSALRSRSARGTGSRTARSCRRRRRCTSRCATLGARRASARRSRRCGGCCSRGPRTTMCRGWGWRRASRPSRRCVPS